MRTRHLTSALILLLFLGAFYFLSVRLTSQLIYLKAINHIRDGNYEIAVIHLEKAARKQPNDPLIWKGLGRAYHHLGSSMIGQKAFNFMKKSNHAYLKATLLNPLDAASFYSLAQETAKLEQMNFYLNPAEGSGPYNALPFFERAVQLRPNGIRYHYALAFYMNQKGEKKELFPIVSNLVRIYPPVYSNLKKEVFWSPELIEAVKKGMLQAIEGQINPRNTHMNLSSLLSEEKDWAGAINHYQKALDLQSSDNTSANFFHLGRLYLQNGQLEAAEEIFFKALSLSRTRENDLEKFYGLYKARGYSEKLHRFLHRVGKEFDLSARIDILLVRILIDRKQYREARQILLALNEKAPSGETYIWLARIAEIEKDWDSVALALQKATALDPTNSQYHLKFSQVLKRMNKLGRAEKAAGLAIQHADKPSAGLFNHRAQIRWSRNKFNGAAGDWEEAVRLNPTVVSYHTQAAEAYIRSGRRSLAKDHYQKAIALDPKNSRYRKKYNELTGSHTAE
ncbi:tetratricopeptide repeat protein [Thermodesulfobacteriota bacterium]